MSTLIHHHLFLCGFICGFCTFVVGMFAFYAAWVLSWGFGGRMAPNIG